jgi:hypothetical protein
MSAPGGSRTPNLLIRSQMLYPLSYRRRSPSIANETFPGRTKARPAGQTNRRATAQRVSSRRLDSCSFRRTEDTWVSTVFTLRWSSAAASL